jgi:hypothetical protein
MTKQGRRRSLRTPTKSPDRNAETRAGMPASDSIEAVVDFVSPGNRKYRILKTSERDAYDKLNVPRNTEKNRKKST